MKRIYIYNKEHTKIEEISLREIASWRDSKILATTPYDESINLMQLVDEYRNDAITIPLPVNTDLNTAIEILKKRQEEDYADYKINFNGTWLYSININEIDAYTSVTGMTREGCIKREQIERYRMQLRQEQEAADAKENFEKRINEGKKEIIEEKWSSWEELVEKLSRPPYYLHAIDTMIKYLRLLNTSYLSVTEIATKFHEEFGNETGDHYTRTILTHLARFSKRGTDLFRAAAYIAKEKGDKVANNKEYLKKIDNANKLIELGIPFEDAEVLAKEDIYDVNIGTELKFKLINIDENLYEGISNTGKYTIVARIGTHYATYIFSDDSYTRYLSHIISPEVLISTNKQSIKRKINAPITGVKMRNIMKTKATIYHETNAARKNVNVGLILEAYKEISELSKEIESNYIGSQVIDCIANIGNKKLTKRM